MASTTFTLAPSHPWPQVPACYGWLRLDRRGQWRLQGEPVQHAGLQAFLNQHYACDEAGNWFVQNGPQRVYVSLDYAPWVLRLATPEQLLTHTGAAPGPLDAAYVDEDGSLLLVTARGLGLVDDRDLPALLDQVQDAAGQPAGETALLALLAGEAPALALRWDGRALPLDLLQRCEAPARFGYKPAPSPA